MPDILPPQLAGVQQRPFYVKVRSAITVISSVWLILAIAGYGFFSGGTTSLALSLALMYGTGAALLVVASALYRLVKRSAMHRTETAPEDAAAAVFLDATRSAAEELMEALLPARQHNRPMSAVRFGGESDRTGTAAPAAVKESVSSPANAASAAKAPAAKQSSGKESAGVAAKPTAAKSVAAKPTAKKPAAKQSESRQAEPAQPADKPAAVKSAVNKKAAAKKKKGGGKNSRTGDAQAAKKQPAEVAAPAKETAGAGQGPAAVPGPAAGSEARRPTAKAAEALKKAA